MTNKYETTFFYCSKILVLAREIDPKLLQEILAHNPKGITKNLQKIQRFLKDLDT